MTRSRQFESVKWGIIHSPNRLEPSRQELAGGHPAIHSQTGFSRSSGVGSCGKNPLEAVLIWMILLTPRQSRPVISQVPYERP